MKRASNLRVSTLGSKTVHHLLQCELKKADIPDDISVAFYLADGHCTDMGGAIKLAKFLLPGVRRIATFSGDNIDTRYFLINEEWEAYLPTETGA